MIFIGILLVNRESVFPEDGSLKKGDGEMGMCKFFYVTFFGIVLFSQVSFAVEASGVENEIGEILNEINEIKANQLIEEMELTIELIKGLAQLAKTAQEITSQPLESDKMADDVKEKFNAITAEAGESKATVEVEDRETRVEQFRLMVIEITEALKLLLEEEKKKKDRKREFEAITVELEKQGIKGMTYEALEARAMSTFKDIKSREVAEGNLNLLK